MSEGTLWPGYWHPKMHRNPEIALFMDIGTNGEIAVGNNEWLITAACSMGPCFEGSGISHGMRATEGAIESVKIDPVTFEPTFGVIGDTKTGRDMRFRHDRRYFRALFHRHY